MLPKMASVPIPSAVAFNNIFIHSSTFNRSEKNTYDMLFKFRVANLLLLTENEDNDVQRGQLRQ